MSLVGHHDTSILKHFYFSVYACLQEWKQGLSKLEAKIESGEEDTEQIQKRERELEQAIQRWVLKLATVCILQYILYAGNCRIL